MVKMPHGKAAAGVLRLDLAALPRLDSDQRPVGLDHGAFGPGKFQVVYW